MSSAASPQIQPEPFVDFYEFMQISPNAEQETVQRVFRMLAARFHPDNPRSGDLEKFILLRRAYRTLRDPSKRAGYDVQHQIQSHKPFSIFGLRDFALGIDGEANRRLGILCLLYNRRRTTPDEPGMSLLDLESLMSIPREHLMFALWYLLEKEFLRRDDRSNYVITAGGADYVEKNLPSSQTLYGLLKSAENGNSLRDEESCWEPETPVVEGDDVA